jgi:hypothetical protein
MELALTERPSTVKAGIINCEELVAHVGNGDRQAVDLEFTYGARRDFILSRGTHKTHLPAPSARFGFFEILQLIPARPGRGDSLES